MDEKTPYDNNKSIENIDIKDSKNKTVKEYDQKPTPAFIIVSWLALGIGMTGFCIGLWKANMQLNEKGYYFAILLFGLFSVLSVQKNVRDKLEGIPVTEIYFGISWFAAIVSITLLVIGLWNANLQLSEKGFYGISYILCLYAAIAVQKTPGMLSLLIAKNKFYSNICLQII